MRKDRLTYFKKQLLEKQRQLQPELPPTEMISDGDATLPADAAPFLSFKHFSRKPRIWELYGPTPLWTNEDRQRLAPFRVIVPTARGILFVCSTTEACAGSIMTCISERANS